MSTKIVYVFHGTLPSFKYLFKNGKEAAFKGGKFITDNEEESKELVAEIAAGHPFIYQKAGEEKMEASMLDPINALRAKMFKEFMALSEDERAALMDPKRDLGTSQQQPLKPANTVDIAAATLGGPPSSATVNPQLMDLQTLIGRGLPANLGGQ